MTIQWTFLPSLIQICYVVNVFWLVVILKIFLLETTKPIQLWLQEWSLGGPVLNLWIVCWSEIQDGRNEKRKSGRGPSSEHF
jgi:hypothetical protein